MLANYKIISKVITTQEVQKVEANRTLIKMPVLTKMKKEIFHTKENIVLYPSYHQIIMIIHSKIMSSKIKSNKKIN